MANSPILWGANETAINLQKQSLTSRGELLQNDGPRNLIGYNRFENGLTTGWSLGTVGTLTNGIPTGTPTFGSGASGNLTLGVNSSTPIDGNFSLSYASSAATTQGDMLATEALTVNTGLQAKVLTFKFYYLASSGSSNCNFSGTSSNSYGVACWDVSNSSWLPLAGNFSMTQGSGVGVATGTMQTNATTASVRFVIYNVNATAGAATLLFDDFYLGPQTAPIGPVVTDEQSFTPTGSWSSNTTYTGKWRRVGDRMELEYLLTLSGAPTSASLTLNLPSGYSIDTNKILSTASNLGTMKYDAGTAFDAGTNSYQIRTRYSSSTAVAIMYQTSATGTADAAITQAAPVSWGNGDFLQISFSVPISGWSSNVQMSNDTDTRVISAVITSTSTQSVTTTPSKFQFNTVVFDDAGAFDTANNRYVVQVAGKYNFSGVIRYGTAGALLTSNAYLYKNGVQLYVLPLAVPSGASYGVPFTFMDKANPGDYYEIWAFNSTATSAVSGSILNINRLSGPAVIAATESVNARYTNTAGTSYSAGVEADLPFATKDFDSHNSYNGTTFTCLISGKYRVNAGIKITSAASGGLAIFVNKNGSRATRLGVTSATALGVNGSDLISCNAGDTLVFRFICDVATSLSTAVGDCHMNIERIGN